MTTSLAYVYYRYIQINMKLFSVPNNLFSSQKGFTLIELLVVIGILGILAASLVATIDPFEQLKKADDSKIKNIAVEYQTANVRYYTTHGAFPWNDATSAAAANNTGCTDLGAAAFSLQLGAAGMIDCIDDADNSLIAEGELKAAFTSNLTDLNRVYVTWDDTDQTNMVVCFSPRSKSQKASPESQYNSDGTANAACPDSGAADDTCYWCTR